MAARYPFPTYEAFAEAQARLDYCNDRLRFPVPRAPLSPATIAAWTKAAITFLDALNIADAAEDAEAFYRDLTHTVTLGRRATADAQRAEDAARGGLASMACHRAP